MIIQKYTPSDADRLFAMIEHEGEEWKDYWQGDGRTKYEKVLADCFAYLVFERVKFIEEKLNKLMRKQLWCLNKTKC